MALGDGIRRNIATVSKEERDRLRDAIIKLQTQQHYPGVRSDSPVGGVSYWFKQDEIHANTHVHFCPAFVPWHRELINRFEESIREIDPQLSLHYWDWTQDPTNLPDGQGGTINLFTADFFGQPNAQFPGEPMQADNSPYRPDGFYVPNANPFRSDNEFDPNNRLAQRNLAIDPSASPVAHSFMIRPSAARGGLARAAGPQAVVERFAFDELMIRWNDMPRDTKATLYVPEWDADQVLQLAATRQHPNVLHKVDAHTLAIDLADATFVPVPGAAKASYAGLITLTLPDSVRTGQVYRADFQQIARLQRFNGSFRFTVPVGDKTRMLPDEIRRLAVLRYIAQGKPAGSRWQPIFARWIATQAGKVKGLGGDPDQVPPSLTDPQAGGEPKPDEGRVTGKVRRLFYDCFGDFTGFDLEDCSECRHFPTGERGIEEIVRRACRERSWVTVLIDEDSRRICGILIECTHHRS